MSAEVADAVDVAVLVIEVLGALIIVAGVGRVTVPAVLGALNPAWGNIEDARLSLARALLLGLEFEVAADVLATAIAPTFTEIGKLAAVAAIRTVLGLVLSRELRAA
ncbi:MAG: hypothetical protein AVDCRST_MAG85-3093 [uncultured Solirubrobacteraceae bacterium]|uniref:DUF1622 domain-containing protein n=1 Tax=uncultured Solirubrobacteraceae bacterium TaxID=1162706 RepID=A0A6J4TJN3_9ACTN|nr:MAG: hypothetical protein AVDCRST_MAG85-3093 [uncultured Solirubrobacteraceae bacterium]